VLKRIQPQLLLTSATLLLAAGATPALAQQYDTSKVAIVSTEVMPGNLDETMSAPGDVMDAAMRELFQSAGFTAEIVPAQDEDRWLSDRELAMIGRDADARWVVYPKILGMRSDPTIGGSSELGLGPVLYTRVIDASAPGPVKTRYMRQVGYPWERPTESTMTVADREGIPLGVIYLLQFFQPLDRELTARGQPSMRNEPETLVSSIWTDERVAGFREAIGGVETAPDVVETEPSSVETEIATSKRVPVMNRETGETTGYAFVRGTPAQLDRVQVVVIENQPAGATGEVTVVYVPMDSTDLTAAQAVPDVEFERMEDPGAVDQGTPLLEPGAAEPGAPLQEPGAVNEGAPLQEPGIR
jgi:hypothetical protein